VKRLVYATFLVAVSLGAQTGPAAQNTEPAAAASQVQPQPQTPAVPVVREYSLVSEEARQILLDKGYFSAAQPQLSPTRCAIPLRQMRVPNKEGSAIRTIPANPSIDPKIVSAPQVPACATTELPLTIAPSQPAAEKK
jgi:hypothetical protein